MMDFIRGLAPRRELDTSWAVPVLPSRFAGPRPLGLASSPTETHVDTSRRVDDEFQPLVRAQAPLPEPYGASKHVAISDVTAVPQAPQPLPKAPPAPLVQPPSIAVAQQPASTLAEPAIERPAYPPLTRIDADPGAVSKPSVELVKTRTAALAGTPERAARDDVAIDVSRPLPPAVLAGRPSAPASERPSIHVTIDRIEVHSPASPRPTPTARKRTSEPAVSLSDYLRRPPPSGGAA